MDEYAMARRWLAQGWVAMERTVKAGHKDAGAAARSPLRYVNRSSVNEGADVCVRESLIAEGE